LSTPVTVPVPLPEPALAKLPEPLPTVLEENVKFSVCPETVPVPLPVSFLLILVLMVVTYLALAEAGKALFYRQRKAGPPLASRKPSHHRRVERLATRWSALRLEPPPPRAGASR